MSDLRKGTEMNSSAFIPPPRPFSQRFLQMPAMLGFHYSREKLNERKLQKLRKILLKVKVILSV